MVEERTAVSRVEEIIANDVLLREFSLRQVGCIEVAQDQAGIVTPGDEFIHGTRLWFKHPVVDLELLVVEAVNDVAGRVRRGRISCQIIWNQRQSRLAVSRWKRKSGPPLFACGV